jgi:hypothetical protein
MAPGTTRLFKEMEDALNSGWIDFGVSDTEPDAGTVICRRVPDGRLMFCDDFGSCPVDPELHLHGQLLL